MRIKFTTEVRDLSLKGLGVVDGPEKKTFFVRGTWPGDLVECEIDNESEEYQEALLLNIVSFSKDRVQLKCQFRGTNPGQCGGCPWMIADYSSQLKYKVKRLVHALNKRNISLGSNVLKSVIPSEKIFHYRNRVQLKSNGTQLGYVSEGTSIFAPIDECIIMNEKLGLNFQKLKKTLPREDFTPSAPHPWCFVDLDDEMELDCHPAIVNKRRPFKQGNTEQNEKMRNWIRDKFINLPRHSPVIDLFCGSGNFTEVLIELGFENVLAVEVQGLAIQNLKQKNLPGVKILELDMNEKGQWAKIAKHSPHAKAIIIDPPREGIQKRRGLFKYLDNLKDIFYISCELDTYSRDLADFIHYGWTPQDVAPIDLFPHTPHIETLSHLKK